MPGLEAGMVIVGKFLGVPIIGKEDDVFCNVVAPNEILVDLF